jgi:type II restriction enzyme
MITPAGERAIKDCLQFGNALLKFVSPNDAGATHSHQAGFYLPKPVWEMYTPHGPEPGRNDKHPVLITWQDGRVTHSVVTWYGRRKREYRLTRFGPDFPFLAEDVVGDLFVLIPRNQQEFNAHVLDYDEDIEELRIALGLDAFDDWGIYRHGVPRPEESEDECIERQIRGLLAEVNEFPSGALFSKNARTILSRCARGFQDLTADEYLLQAFETEYHLFRDVERLICQNEVTRLFRDIDDFLHTAGTIMNRRKARAGRSLENHVEFLLRRAKIPHTMRPALDADGRPDILIPSEDAYRDIAWAEDRLFVVGLKTTCKDRWRQILNEAPRMRAKPSDPSAGSLSGSDGRDGCRQCHPDRAAAIASTFPEGPCGQTPER